MSGWIRELEIKAERREQDARLRYAALDECHMVVEAINVDNAFNKHVLKRQILTAIRKLQAESMLQL